MVVQTITGLVAGVADIVTHTNTNTHTHTQAQNAVPPARNKNKNKPWESEDAGEKVVRQCLLEQCSEVAGLNAQVVFPAIPRALPTLKSFRT